jgi:hypothetical protein
MRLITILVVLLCPLSDSFAEDRGVRALLGVYSAKFPAPMSPDGDSVRFAVLSYLNGQRVGPVASTEWSGLNRPSEVEVLWKKDGDRIKVLIMTEHASTKFAMDVAEDVEVSSVHPVVNTQTEDGWRIAAYWCLDPAAERPGATLYSDFKRNVETHRRILAVAVKENRPNKSLQPTPTAVTPPAAQEIVPAVGVAEH